LNDDTDRIGRPVAGETAALLERFWRFGILALPAAIEQRDECEVPSEHDQGREADKTWNELHALSVSGTIERRE
jgi:hypothetical protein